MKLGLISDTHIEIYPRRLIKVLNMLLTSEADVLVLAGDIGNISQVEVLTKELNDAKRHTILVHGNHECYTTTRVNVVESLTKFSNNNEYIHFLNNSAVTLYDKTIYGGCMWTNFLSSPVNALTAMRWINDFRMIHDMKKYHGIDEMITQHSLFRTNSPETIDICVTHFSPSLLGVGKWAGDPLNPYYHNDMGLFAHDKEVKLWLHGHIHEDVDYLLGETRVLTNPIGYDMENRTDKGILEIDL